MDEPFGALDAMTREQLYGDIQRIWSQHRKTIVFVTHNVREAVCLGDRVILFHPTPDVSAKEFNIPLPGRVTSTVWICPLRRDYASLERIRVQSEVAG